MKNKNNKPYKPGATLRKPLPGKTGGPIGGKKGKKGYNRKKLKNISLLKIDEERL